MLVYAFLAVWVLLLDTVVSEQRYLQQRGRVSSSTPSSQQSSSSSSSSDVVVVHGSHEKHWLNESLPGRAGYLCLFVYLAVGGFARDILGPLSISFQVGAFSSLTSLASLGLLLGVLLVAWLAVKCVLARSALDCEGEVRWVTRQAEAAAQRQLKAAVIAEANRQREAAVVVESSDNDNNTGELRRVASARHELSTTLSVDRGAGLTPGDDAVFVDQRFTRDALLPFCHCSAAEWTKHVDATRRLWTAAGWVSPRLTFFLPVRFRAERGGRTPQHTICNNRASTHSAPPSAAKYMAPPIASMCACPALSCHACHVDLFCDCRPRRLENFGLWC